MLHEKAGLEGQRCSKSKGLDFDCSGMQWFGLSSLSQLKKMVGQSLGLCKRDGVWGGPKKACGKLCCIQCQF